MHPPTSTIERLFGDHHARLCGSLQRCFRSVPGDVVADGVQDAFADLLARPSLPEDPERLLFTIAWRKVRSEVRSARVRCHASFADGASAVDPAGRLEARHRLRVVDSLVPAAASRFGGRQPHHLRVALGLRLSGATDTSAAQAAGVRREAVNRAMHWLRDHLE
ncbi:MAG: hypothetical protein R3F60_00840 [bacterium]